MVATFHHHEGSATIRAPAERVFELADEHASLSAHMGQPSWRMAWSRMQVSMDEQKGQSIGSHIRLEGKISGIRLALDEVVTERDPPRSKSWETVGSPRLLVIGHYRMGFDIAPKGSASLLRVYIDYTLPDRAPECWLGFLFGWYYARWCVQQMLDSALHHFSKP